MKQYILFIALMISSLSVFADSREIRCLSDVIYFEARSESVIGRQAVGNVVFNRMNDSRFPNTVCKVVYQPRQFSWTAVS